MRGMSTPRFSIGRLAAATVIIAVFVLACARFANALKHARMGEMSREEAQVDALEKRVDALENRVHSMPEP